MATIPPKISGKRARAEADKALRRQAILESTEAIIREKGLEGIRMDAIAKSVGLSKGTLYLYFPKKEDLLAELTLQARQHLLATFKAYVARADNPVDQLRAVLWASFDVHYQRPVYGRLIAFYEESSRNLEESPVLVQASLEISHFVAAIAEEGQRLGYIREEVDAFQLTFMMWGTAVGMIQLTEVKGAHIQEQLRQSTREFYHDFVEFFINSLTPLPASK